MYFYLIGIDYKSAPIEVRDKIYRTGKNVSDFWASTDPEGSTILTTCNRLEVYGAARYADDAFGNLRRFFENFPYFAKYAYLKYGETDVFRHSLRLASGLESQIIGEMQVLEQLKRWRGHMPDNAVSDLWDKAISFSQRVRTASGLDDDNDNIAAVVFDDIRMRKRPKKKYEITVVGTGKIAGLFAKYSKADTVVNFAAHKNYKKALDLADESGGAALYLKDLRQVIAGADALICATSSPHYVVGKDHLNNLTTGRGHPLYIYDLAIPQDTTPDVRNIDGVYTQNLDDLGPVFYRHNESKKERIKLASKLIEDVLKVRGGVVYDKNY
jgi:glutamyl-tRNA reductase